MMTRRIPLAPREGWLTLGVVLLMCLTLAWSIDDVGWVLGNEEYLDFLVHRGSRRRARRVRRRRRSAGAAG